MEAVLKSQHFWGDVPFDSQAGDPPPAFDAPAITHSMDIASYYIYI